jgi:hypothetical protein
MSVMPVDNAGLEVNRGNKSANAALLWIEASEQWSISGNTAQSVSTYIASNTLVELYAAAGNAYSQQVGAAGNSYTNFVGASANAYSAETYATRSNVSIVYNTANVAFDTANDAFASANNVAPQIAPSYRTANNAYDTANAAFAAANTLAPAYGTANNAYDTANAAFGKANNALANTTGTFAGNLTISGSTTANNGFYSRWDYRGPFTDGIVVDYVEGVGRVSVGANDSLTLFNHGVGNIPILTITEYGFVGIGTTNPLYPVTVIANGATTTTLAGAVFSAEGSENGYVQLNIRNANNGSDASSDFVATADDGDDTSNYIDLGINSSQYAHPGFTIAGAHDGYLYTSNGNLAIGTANSTAYKSLSFFTGGTLAGNEVLRIQDGAGGANIGIGRTDPNYKIDVVGSINASNILINGIPLGTASVKVSNTAPSLPAGGNMWWDTESGKLYIYYIDADSAQWVEAFPSEVGIDTSFIIPVYQNANLAYSLGNTIYASVNSNWTVTNTVFDVANAAFASANNVAPQIAPSYTTANLAYFNSNAAFIHANAAFDSANNVAPQVTPSYNTANMAFNTANAAFAVANNVAPQVEPAFRTANNAYLTANLAFDKANAGGANIGQTAPTGSNSGRLWWNSDLGKLFIYYTDPANTSSWVETNPSSSVIEAAIITGYINPVSNTANAAYAVANAGYSFANTRLANSTATYSGNLTIDGNLSFTANDVITLPIGPTAARPGTAANGMIRYNTTLNTFEGYKAGTWGAIGGGATGGGSDDAFYENTANITSDYTITTGKNAMTAGPVTMANGVTITIPAGSTWTVV